MKKIYVIAGGPGNGKTTLIEKFKEKGFFVLLEPARILGEKFGINFSDNIKGKERFKINNIVFDEYLKRESNLPKNTIVILDSGMPDNIPYYIYCPGMKIPNKYLEACKNRYEKVFILEPLNSYEKDDVRGESKEEATILHHMKYDAYASLGYKVINVPLFSNKKEESLEKRFEFIKSFF